MTQRTADEVRAKLAKSSERIEASKRWEMVLMKVRGDYAKRHFALEAELAAIERNDNDRAE